MCFRPSQADMSVMCPDCGKKVSSLGGIPQTKCPFCNADLASARAATAADNLSVAPVRQPTVPTANPAAPEAPGAPKAPAAPPAGRE